MEQAGTSGLKSRLRMVLKELPREDLLLLMLGYADGLTDVEIGQLLGVDSAAVARHRRALIAQLRRSAAGRTA